MADRVLLLTDAGADRHASPGHPERPERRDAVCAGVRDAAGEWLAEESPEPVAAPDLVRIHPAPYLDLLDDAERRGGGWLDADTYLVRGSMAAARLAAGATVHAARAARDGETVAFAAVRPPGHHAAKEAARGFCLLNNVAIAAAALLADGADRVAIVDWDVHHGDGTQEIFWDDPDVLYLSTHQSPFYPGTGSADERGGGVAIGLTRNRPLRAGDGDDAFTAAWTEELLPALVSFAPNAILVSAGFDAHRDDPLAELRVTERGYRTVALAVGEAALDLGIPGVALTLEGGYDLHALRASAAASVSGLLEGLGRR